MILVIYASQLKLKCRKIYCLSFGSATVALLDRIRLRLGKFLSHFPSPSKNRTSESSAYLTNYYCLPLCNKIKRNDIFNKAIIVLEVQNQDLSTQKASNTIT